MNDSKLLDFSFGWLHPPNMRYIGFAVMVFVLIIVVTDGELLSLLGFIPAIWLAFRRSGVQVDLLEDTYREYTESFAIKRGKWISMEQYPDMALLRGVEGFKAYSRAMIELSDSEVVWDIYLLKKDHRSRLILKRCKSKDEGEKLGPELAEQMGKNWTVYSPKLSEKTRARRRR